MLGADVTLLAESGFFFGADESTRRGFSRQTPPKLGCGFNRAIVRPDVVLDEFG
jgi:hypothetical protein